MLMGSHNGGIDHHVLIVVITSQVFEYTLENTTLALASQPLVRVLPVPEALGKITPRDACGIPIEHCLNEQPIVRGRSPDVPFTSGQKLLDPIPLIVS